MGGLTKLFGGNMPKAMDPVRMPTVSDADRLQQERDRLAKKANTGREGTKMAQTPGNNAYQNDVLGS